MKPVLRGAAILCVVVLIVSWFGDEARSARSIKIVSWALPKSPHEIALQEFAKRVRERTKDGILIEVVDGTKAGIPIGEGLARVQSGQVDGAVLPTTVLEAAFPKIAAITFPFLFADYEHVDKTMTGDVGKQLLRELSEVAKVVGLEYVENGFVDLASRDRPIKTAQDLRGRKVRIARPLSRASFAALGTSPVQLAFAEVSPALAQGVVDSAEVVVYSGARGDADFAPILNVAKYVSLTEHTYLTNVVVIRSSVFSALSEPEKRVLVDSARESAILGARLGREGRREAVRQIERKGMTVLIPDRAELRKSLDEIFRDPPQGVSKDVLETIRKICRLPPFCG